MRFRMTDDAKKVDARRVVVTKRKSGRFVKKGQDHPREHLPVAGNDSHRQSERPPSGGRSYAR